MSKQAAFSPIEKMSHIPYQIDSLPQEVLLRIVDFLPFTSRCYLALANKPLNTRLQGIVHQQSQELREQWRIVNVEEHYHPGQRYPWNLSQVLTGLVNGDVFGSFIQRLICAEGLNNCLECPHGSNLDKVTIETIVEQNPLINNHVLGSQFLDMLAEGNENACLPLVLSHTNNLRQLGLPPGFAETHDAFDIGSMLKSIACRNARKGTIAALHDPDPLRNLSKVFVAAANGEDGPGLSDLYLLLALPSLRVLHTSQCHSNEDRKPLVPYDPCLPLSKVENFKLDSSAITLSDLKILSQAIGVPCTISHTWEGAYSRLNSDDTIRWFTCKIDPPAEGFDLSLQGAYRLTITWEDWDNGPFDTIIWNNW